MLLHCSACLFRDVVEGRSQLERSLEGMEGVEASERIVQKGLLESVILQPPPSTALPQAILRWRLGDQKVLAQNFPTFLRTKEPKADEAKGLKQ